MWKVRCKRMFYLLDCPFSRQERFEEVNSRMDTTLIVQLSFYLLVLLLIVVGLFTLFKRILTFVFIRGPKQPTSQRFTPRRLASVDTIEPEVEMVSLPPVAQGGFVGREGQLPDAICRKTGTPVRYCDCPRCRRISGKVGN